MTTIEETLLRLLTHSKLPLPASELQVLLKKQGTKLETYQIIDHLRNLQHQGYVEFKLSKWHILKPLATITSKPQTTKILGFETNKGQKSSPSIAPPRPQRQNDPESRWNDFRRLCKYYMDCIFQDDSPQLKSYLDNENESWIPLRSVPWARVASDQDFDVILERKQAAFVRNRNRKAEEECIFLCYPHLLLRKEGEYEFLIPLFVQPMQSKWINGLLQLTPDGPVAVNGCWIESRFKRLEERTAFLKAIGFFSSSDDSLEDAEQIGSDRNIATFAQRAASYLFDDKRFSIEINPQQLSYPDKWSAATPGLINIATLSLGPRLKYTRSLLKDLREIVSQFSDEELDGTALSQVFPHEPATKNQMANKVIHESFASTHIISARLLHDTQRIATMNALSAEASVITGPPGTGKSEVVAGIMVNQLLRGKPTLFASKNHQSLAAVIPRLNKEESDIELVIQTASRDLTKRQSYLEKLRQLLSQPPRQDAERGDELQSKLHDLFSQQEEKIANLAALSAMRSRCEALAAELSVVQGKVPESLRSDDSIRTWPLEKDWQYLGKLKTEAEQLFGPVKSPLVWLKRLLFSRDHKREQSRVLTELQELPGYTSLKNPKEHDVLIDKAWHELFEVAKARAQCRTSVEAMRLLEVEISGQTTANELTSQLEAIQIQINAKSEEWIQWASGGLPAKLSPHERESLGNLRAGIQTWGEKTFAEQIKTHFPTILRAFPLWSVSNLSARRALPLCPGIFDLVIIDEASQCDIPSIIPLLARSKRMVISGDPMQLQHVSTLDASIEQMLMKQHRVSDIQFQRFSYRNSSAFNLAETNSRIPDAQRSRLDMHFRSHPEIAGFCNEAFYSNTLHVVTASDKLNLPKGQKPGIHWTSVRGPIQSAHGGGCHAPHEVESIVEILEQLAADDFTGTIGVVTPFRQQTNRIQDRLERCSEKAKAYFARSGFIMDTAHGFQGNERDLILFSLCGGPDMPEGSGIFLKGNPNLFNVAASRARAVLHVIGDQEWALSCGIPFISKLANRPNTQSVDDHSLNPELYESPWEKRLHHALAAEGIRCIPQYPIAGRRLDLAVLGQIRLDIEVDGEAYHRTEGGQRKDDDHWRDLQLKSLGWKVARFWVYQLREDMPGCVNQVKKMIIANTTAHSCPVKGA